VGFWNALSVLAPVAPALADAQVLRTERQQQAQSFATDQALKQAQLTTQRLADQAQQQRLAQGAQPTIIGEPQWDPTTHTNRVLTFDKNTGALAMRDAPGVDPQQVAADKYQQAKQDYKKIAGRDLTPEEDQALFFQSYGYKPLPAKVTPLAGAAGQPQEYPKGSGQYVVFGRGADGNVVAQPVPAGFTPPAPKPLSPAVRYTNLAAKQILASQGKGPALTPAEAADLTAARGELTLNGISTANARAIANARYGITNVTDNDTGEEVAQTRLNVANAANSGTPFAAGAVGAPTGLDKKDQLLAQSAIMQATRMQNLLKSDPTLTGPGAGQLTRLQMFLGNQSPEAQQLLLSSLLASEHGVAVFGGRNIHTIADLQNALGSMKTNPAALSGALDVLKESMQPWVTAGGRLPARAGVAGGSNNPAASPTYKLTATGPNNHKIGSNDNGQTWYDIATGKKVQ
jgi:hypothetical protein